jgi:hypothetical protein
MYINPARPPLIVPFFSLPVPVLNPAINNPDRVASNTAMVEYFSGKSVKVNIAASISMAGIVMQNAINNAETNPKPAFAATLWPPVFSCIPLSPKNKLRFNVCNNKFFRTGVIDELAAKRISRIRIAGGLLLLHKCNGQRGDRPFFDPKLLL